MIERGEGWIVNVSSGSARHNPGPPFRTEGVAVTIGDLRRVEGRAQP